MKPKQKKFLKIGIAGLLLFIAACYWKPSADIFTAAFKALLPLLIGGASAYVLNILMSFYERHYFPKSKRKLIRKSARPVCILGAFLTLFLIIGLIVSLVVPELISCISLLFAKIPSNISSFTSLLEKFDSIPDDVVESLRNADWNSALTKLIGILTSGIGSTVSFAAEALSSVASFIVNMVIGAIFAVYILADKEHLKSQFNRLLNGYAGRHRADKVRSVLSVINGCFHKYIVGQCTEAVILGTLCTIGMFIFGFDYAVMTGTVVGVTALIPIAGAYIGGAVGFLLILSVSPVKALLFVLYLLILQQLEGNLIYPKVVGSSIGLPGIWVLAAVTVSGGIFGIPGMFLGVPLTAAAYQLLRKDINRKEKLSSHAAE